MICVNYAVQVCDLASYQGGSRFCGDDRTILSKKSLQSLINSIAHCVDQRPSVQHHVMMVHDHTSEDLIKWITAMIDRHNGQSMTLELHALAPRTGIADSIEYCYQWLQQNHSDLIFQVQDDYLFDSWAIYDSLDQFYQIYQDCGIHAVIQPFNDISHWNHLYKNSATPRMISTGCHGYWIQIYDTSCSFMTSQWQFNQHWDLYREFFRLIPEKSPHGLESRSLNHMFTRRGVLGMTPVNTLSHHIQQYPDPYQSWKKIWDQINIHD